MKRRFYRTVEGQKLLFHVFKNSDGKLHFTAEEPGGWDVCAHQITPTEHDIKFAEDLFNREEENEVPHLNLDVNLTDEDAYLLAQLDEYFLRQLRVLTRFSASRNLEIASHHGQVNECLLLAKKWKEVALKSAEYERAVAKLINSPVRCTPESANEEPVFFDTWGEGPFSLEEAIEYSRHRPKDEFHTTGGVSVREFMESDKPAETALVQLASTVVQPASRRRWSWPLALAKSVLALFV